MAHRAFGAYAAPGQTSRDWATSFAASAAIYVALAIGVVTLGSAAKQVARMAAVELKFVEKIVNEPPPPPPPPIVDVKPQAPAAIAPVVRPDQKVRHLEKPPPPKEMVAPKTMPEEAPREADPSEDKGVAVYGAEGKGDPAGLEGGVAQGGTVGGQVGGAIALPEDAVAPMPARTNPVAADVPWSARGSAPSTRVTFAATRGSSRATATSSRATPKALHARRRAPRQRLAPAARPAIRS